MWLLLPQNQTLSLLYRPATKAGMEIRVNLSDDHVQALAYLASLLGADMSGAAEWAIEQALTPNPDEISSEAQQDRPAVVW